MGLMPTHSATYRKSTVEICFRFKAIFRPTSRPRGYCVSQSYFTRIKSTVRGCLIRLVPAPSPCELNYLPCMFSFRQQPPVLLFAPTHTVRAPRDAEAYLKQQFPEQQGLLSASGFHSSQLQTRKCYLYYYTYYY